MTELEDDLGVPHGKSICPRNAAAQNERVVIETRVGSIGEDGFSDLRPEPSLGIVDEAHAGLLGGFLPAFANAVGLGRDRGSP
jgi:hypothetical protein